MAGGTGQASASDTIPGLQKEQENRVTNEVLFEAIHSLKGEFITFQANINTQLLDFKAEIVRELSDKTEKMKDYVDGQLGQIYQKIDNCDAKVKPDPFDPENSILCTGLDYSPDEDI